MPPLGEDLQAAFFSRRVYTVASLPNKNRDLKWRLQKPNCSVEGRYASGSHVSELCGSCRPVVNFIALWCLAPACFVHEGAPG